jgi:hypothetical protein
MARLSPTTYTIYGKRVPAEPVPVVEVNQGSTVCGEIDMRIQGLTSIDGISVTLNKLNPPIKGYRQYEVLAPDLSTPECVYYSFSGTKIQWRCSVVHIEGVAHGNLYGLRFGVNKESINSLITYQPDIVLRVVDILSKDAINE